MDITIKFKDGHENKVSNVDWIIVYENKIVINKSYDMFGYTEIVLHTEHIKYYSIEKEITQC